MKEFIAEFIGTFLLVFFGTLAIVVNNFFPSSLGNLGIATSFGLVVTCVVYTFGNISGAHINPAVTIALWIDGKINTRNAWIYIVVQILAALLASIAVLLVFPESETLGATLPVVDVLPAFLLEFLMSLFLMLVIMNIANKGVDIDIGASLAIGMVVFLDALVGGPLTGASMNPARSIGPALISGHLEHLWLYILSPVLAMVAAVFMWRMFTRNK